MTIKTESIIADKADIRLDHYLAEKLPAYSRSKIQAFIKNGNVKVSQNIVKTGYQLSLGEMIEISFPEIEEMKSAPENIALDILYEDADIIVINKEQGMVVHPAAGHKQGTLVNALLHHCGDLSGVNGVIRPGIVHRIDKDTSGILVVAKNDAAHLGLAEQWKVHSINRIYHALLWGQMSENSGTIDAPIARHAHDRKKMAVDPKNGKHAITHYRVLERFPQENCTYAELQLETGRTHQIRVHMAYLGHPVVGDPVYAPRRPKFGLNGQALHAKVLGFEHPVSKQDLEFDSALPEYFSQLLETMRAK